VARRYLNLAAIDLTGGAEPALAIGDPRGAITRRGTSSGI